jgi:hypothetical protein
MLALRWSDVDLDAEDGLAAMRGMVAMARSAETDEAVRLSEVEGGV